MNPEIAGLGKVNPVISGLKVRRNLGTRDPGIAIVPGDLRQCAFGPRRSRRYTVDRCPPTRPVSRLSRRTSPADLRLELQPVVLLASVRRPAAAAAASYIAASCTGTYRPLRRTALTSAFTRTHNKSVLSFVARLATRRYPHLPMSAGVSRDID